MSVQELYEYLRSPSFLDAKSGNIFYNYYIYQYPAKQEYKMRSQIEDFKERLKRPSSSANAMILDLFSTFCEFLKSETFGKQTLLDMTFEEDKKHPEMVTEELTSEASNDKFFAFVHRKIKKYIEEDDGLSKPYIFICGIGKMFPYLRCNVFLTGYEKYNDTNLYRIILFYPGHCEGNSYSLFDTMHDDHTYRATLLVND
ncbi:MAG: DUF1788 domain-containing protein [Mediterranea sp.]|nr:DUF1788 domain-containing protein [Mediterranea sp.]